MSISGSIQDRAYQQEAEVALIDKWKEGKRAVVLVIGCGGGKTNIACSIIHKAASKRNRVVFLAHRRELITNAQNRLLQYGIQSDVILGGKKKNLANIIQIASIQSILNQDLPPASVVFIDECHTSLSDGYINVINRYKAAGAFIIGLTATPFRTDKKPLGLIYEDYVQPIQNSDLIERGFTLPTKVYGVGGISSKKFKVKMGEFDKDDLSKAFDVNNVYVNLISNYKKFADGQPTIVFCTRVEHSIKTAQCFIDHGYRAKHVDGEMPKLERDKAILDYTNGDLDILVNYGLLAEGFDVPKTRCVIMNCATLSPIKWVQACGRAMRTFGDKTHGIIIDMADNWHRFGSPEENIIVDLNPVLRDKKEKGVAPVSLCGQCYFIFAAKATQCPECGWEKPKYTPQQVKEIEFVELTKKEQAVIIKAEKDEVIKANIEANKSVWESFTSKDWNKIPPPLIQSFAVYKGYKNGWVYNQKKERKLI